MNDTTQTKKIWFGVLLLIIIVAVGVFWYWYMNQQRAPLETELPQASITPPSPAENLEQIENEATGLSIENPDTELKNIEKELGI